MTRGRPARLLLVAAGVAATLVGLGVILWQRHPSLEPEEASPAQEPPGAELPEAAPEEVELHPGAPVERQLAPDEVHAYRISLRVGDFLHLVVEQQGIDVVVTLLDPTGATVARVDEPIGDLGEEPLQALASRTGPHRLEVRSWPGDTTPGAYRLEVLALRPASEEDRLLAEAAGIIEAGDALRRSGEYRESLQSYREVRRRADARRHEILRARAQQRVCIGLSLLREWDAAVVACEAAAVLFRGAGYERLEAISLKDLGVAWSFRGEARRAVELFTRALEMAERRGDAPLRVHLLDLRAASYQVLDEYQRALDDYQRVLAAGRGSQDPRGRGFTVHNLGVFYRLLGQPELARDLLEEAATIWSEMGEERHLGGTLNQLGQLAQDRGEREEAVALYRRALELRRATGDLPGQARTLEKLGRLRLELGEPEQARALVQEAVRLLQGTDDPRRRASVRLILGELDRRDHRIPQSLASYRQALDLYRGVGDLTEQAECLLGIARAERDRRNLEDALAAAEEALALVESARLRSLRQDLRTSFFATVDDHFELTIDLLMALHTAQPEADYAARALAVSEQARARSLLDGLAEAGADIRRGASPDLLRRERELQDRLNEAEAHRLSRLELAEEGGARREGAVAAAEREVRDLVARLAEVRAEIRATSPRYAALTQPRPAELRGIQEELLDGETLLLEYRLGRDRSFLWLVSRNSLVAVELPGRRAIEAQARRAHELLQTSHRREARASLEDALCALGRMLLAPVANRLHGRRLVVVPDGALAYLPFGALPIPPDSAGSEDCRRNRPLITRHEITYLPSASALATLRRGLGGRPPAAGILAVVADPVLVADDERVVRARAGRLSPARALRKPEDTGARPASRSRGALRLARLPFARREAEAILRFAPGGRSLSAFGFDAGKSMVTGERLRGYRNVHFATHGILDSDRPELSALVLSLLDEEGRPRDGYLRAHEVYNLELPAELVVLSGCETALGKEIRGEGLVGLTQGFFYAGAERVVVSLWRVSDRSTAELMERFYRGLLMEGWAPAAALREAQLSMLADVAHEAPYHWAGFVLQGEWQ